MTKKCLYCGAELPDDCIVDFCEKCGVQVFGRKMFDAIIENMNKAKNNGDLCNMKISDFGKPQHF